MKNFKYINKAFRHNLLVIPIVYCVRHTVDIGELYLQSIHANKCVAPDTHISKNNTHTNKTLIKIMRGEKRRVEKGVFAT